MSKTHKIGGKFKLIPRTTGTTGTTVYITLYSNPTNYDTMNTKYTMNSSPQRLHQELQPRPDTSTVKVRLKYDKLRHTFCVF